LSTNQKEEERRLSKIYETALKAEESKDFLLPKNMTALDLKKYIEEMIAAAQPRHLRTEGRKSHNLDDYKIPVNYFRVESNTVPYNSSTGMIYVDGDDQVDVTEGQTNFLSVVPNNFKEYDFGAYICIHIFKNGRKTLDELTEEVTGLDNRMTTLLVNKLIEDGFLRRYKEEEEDLETLELIEKEEQKPKELDVGSDIYFGGFDTNKESTTS
jgi:hypothetical protein